MVTELIFVSLAKFKGKMTKEVGLGCELNENLEVEGMPE